MAEPISWFATVATIIAALIVASNLGPRPTGYGFIIFAIGSVAWFVVGLRTNQPALIWTDSVLTLLNLFGVWRWLGRRAKVEDGAKAAAQASEESPGEALFPVSLLTQAPVRSGSAELGRCVDAMAGCSSGQLAYVVVGEGGVAGVGEVFRRLPWKLAHVNEGVLETQLPPDRFEQIETVPKDDWAES
ncbi:MAG: PRC-barrel domain containing protein [Sphingomicrobium sp.]|jgi:hypothetical protein